MRLTRDITADQVDVDLLVAEHPVTGVWGKATSATPFWSRFVSEETVHKYVPAFLCRLLRL